MIDRKMSGRKIERETAGRCLSTHTHSLPLYRRTRGAMRDERWKMRDDDRWLTGKWATGRSSARRKPAEAVRAPRARQMPAAYELFGKRLQCVAK